MQINKYQKSGVHKVQDKDTSSFIRLATPLSGQLIMSAPFPPAAIPSWRPPPLQ